MKRYLRKVKAMFLAFAITLGMAASAIPVYAAEEMPTTTFEISGIEEGSTVYAYAIALDAVDEKGNHYWQYNPAGQVQIEPMVKSGKVDSGTAVWIYTHLNEGTGQFAHDGEGAAVVDKTVLQATPDANGNYIIRDVKPGLYVLTAEKSEGTTSYNFNIYAANYQYDENGKAYLPGRISFAVKKSSEPSLEKTVEEAGESLKHGDGNIGDLVAFKIALTVPNYAEEWNVDGTRFVVSDTLSSGLALVEDSIKIEGTSLDDYQKQCGNTTFTTSGSGFTLDLRGTDIYQYKDQTISITYQARITENAKVNFDSELNKATIRWSNAPGSSDLSKPKESTTYHYTFGIDTLVNGNGSKETTEVTKYGVRTTTEENNKVLLDGAEFQLLDANKNVLYFTENGKLDPSKTGRDYIVSKNGGKLTATGLDAGTYYLKESKAPLGYALDKTEYKVVINPTYDELTGMLKNYTVQIGDGSTNSITFKYEKNDAGNIIFSNEGTFAINNTPMIKLPETGGVGIIVITVVAVAMMVVFGSVLVLLNKKKRAQ